MAEIESWHRGTRFWKIAGETIFLLFLAIFAALVWRPEAVGSIAGIATITLPVIFGGSSVVKWQEKRNGS